jgi:hypothetical protein
MFDTVSNDGLLVAIESERLPPLMRTPEGKVISREPDEEKLDALIEECVRRGIYPKETCPGNPNTLRQMVRGYGARWFEWRTGHLNCPACSADLRDLEAGPPFLRQCGRVENDRVVAWECPDCGHSWSAG